MKSSELIALSNLDGWRICEGYFIQLEHGLMGTFPARVPKTGKDFVCLSEKAVKRAVSLLPKRPYRADPVLLLVNEKEKIAFMLADVEAKWRDNSNQRNFPVKSRIHYNSGSLALLGEEDLEYMKTGDLKWATGLVGPGMSRDEFTETIEMAAR